MASELLHAQKSFKTQITKALVSVFSPGDGSQNNQTLK